MKKTKIMSNSLMIYLNKRLREEEDYLKFSYSGSPGPVITISREVG